MSADHEFVFYDLISSDPPEWRVRVEESIEPVDRLLTYELEIYQGSPHGKESRRWRHVWGHPNLTAKEITELERANPKPNRMGGSIDWSRLMGATKI
jgi:hypothetical protein